MYNIKMTAKGIYKFQQIMDEFYYDWPTMNGYSRVIQENKGEFHLHKTSVYCNNDEYFLVYKTNNVPVSIEAYNDLYKFYHELYKNNEAMQKVQDIIANHVNFYKNKINYGKTYINFYTVKFYFRAGKYFYKTNDGSDSFDDEEISKEMYLALIQYAKFLENTNINSNPKVKNLTYQEARESGLPFNRSKYKDEYYVKCHRPNVDIHERDLSQRFWTQEDYDAHDWVIKIYYV